MIHFLLPTGATKQESPASLLDSKSPNIESGMKPTTDYVSVV